MKFCDKLSKLRKENNLSQEALADKLGVSRQAVSKWESGTSYPDMDKIINICKILNCNLDDLLEDGIISKTEKNNKLDLSTYFNNFLDFITKSCNMFYSMKLKEKIKCLLELFIIAFILLIFGLIINEVITSTIFSKFYDIPVINTMIYKVISPIVILALITLGVIIFLHLFKIRYLDYFITIEDSNINEKKIEPKIEENKYVYEKKKEKIVIRDPKHSTYSFFNMLLKILTFIIKVFIIMITIPFIVSVIMLIIICSIDITFLNYDAMFIWLLVLGIGLLLLSYVILYFIYNFIFNRQIKFKLMFILSMISLFLIGIGFGFSIINFLDYGFVINENDYNLEEKVLDSKDNLILFNDDIEYIIDNEMQDIKLEIYYSKYLKYEIYSHNSNDYDIYHISAKYDVFGVYKSFKENLKNRKIDNYDSAIKIKAYLSQKNYDIIMKNIENY